MKKARDWKLTSYPVSRANPTVIRNILLLFQTKSNGKEMEKT
ncbi:MAG: hypothetical protein ACFFD4_30475 [Candidatus Odinarchaeota archaeon]